MPGKEQSDRQLNATELSAASEVKQKRTYSVLAKKNLPKSGF